MYSVRNRRRAGNKRRAWKIRQKKPQIRKLMMIKKIELENSRRSWKTFQNF
jgi:hypothetical protein